MANPTTNFGWVMPTSTDLVTDLPADFAVFGQGVDTSLQYLNGGTTGQVLSKTSNTNLAFTWTTPTDQTPLTTKGDLFTFTTVDARLGVGTNGQVLIADSAEPSGLKWGAITNAGKVLQVVSATSTASTGIATSTFTDSGLSATITPSSATSKVLVLINQQIYINRAGITIYAKGQLVRTATSLFANDFIGGFGVPNATGTIENFFTWSPSWLDSPATTSATTYKTQLALNGSGSLTAQAFGTSTSSITLLEIGA